MDLVHQLVLLSMQHNFVVQARHIPVVSNEIADALSHFQMQRFQGLAPGRFLGVLPTLCWDYWQQSPCFHAFILHVGP